MATINKTLCSFHVGRGGRFYNAGHKTFRGFESINELINVLSNDLFVHYENEFAILKRFDNYPNISELVQKAIENEDFTLLKRIGLTETDFGDKYYFDCNGNNVGLPVENDGTGSINFDNDYKRYYVCYLEDLDKNEAELVINHYMCGDDEREFIETNILNN